MGEEVVAVVNEDYVVDEKHKIRVSYFYCSRRFELTLSGHS
jgi:hypothetical protein